MLQQRGIFRGRTEVRYSYSRYGMTRNNGKTMHKGIDVVGIDDPTVLMPRGPGNQILTGTVTRARCVTDKRNKTWEWGNYVCVYLDHPLYLNGKAVRFLYFCHLKMYTVYVGQKVKSGSPLGIMGNTGNAVGGYAHVHLECRPQATGAAVDPTHLAGCESKTGIYGNGPVGDESLLQVVHIGPLSKGDVAAVKQFCLERGYTAQGLIKVGD